MLATDVAARGLHVAGVRFMVNYNFPGCLEQYVHRCRRAGRTNISHEDETEKTTIHDTAAAADDPTIYSFFVREMAPMAKDVFKLLRSCGAWIDPNLMALVGESCGDTADLEYNNGKRKQRRRGGGGAKGRDSGDGVVTVAVRPRGRRGHGVRLRVLHMEAICCDLKIRMSYFCGTLASIYIRCYL